MILQWVKSSFSHMNGNCVEAAAVRKPRRSVNNGACAEVGTTSAGVAVRDSKEDKREDRTVLVFSSSAWRAFTANPDGAVSS